MKRQLLTTRLSQRSDSRSSGTIVDDDATLPDDVTIPDSASLVNSPPTFRRRIQSTPPSYASVKTLKWSLWQ